MAGSLWQLGGPLVCLGTGRNRTRLSFLLNIFSMWRFSNLGGSYAGPHGRTVDGLLCWPSIRGTPASLFKKGLWLSIWPGRNIWVHNRNIHRPRYFPRWRLSRWRLHGKSRIEASFLCPPSENKQTQTLRSISGDKCFEWEKEYISVNIWLERIEWKKYLSIKAKALWLQVIR